ncbi:MAG: DeoR/GlpR family DNA-binding transcription regulator, partial [Lachnospiraceae bacterium]|nr:DeoR/GlpR family DNA-binding transcription regulator [Lachnospiraceae bacterium]
NLDRWNNILAILKQNDFITTVNLAKLLNISEATMRRELNAMQKRGLIIRTQGGARLSETENHVKYKDDLLFRFSTNSDSKQKIAKKAASFIQNGHIIFIDAGSTTAAIVPYITHKDILVVTNNIKAIIELSQHGINSYICNGYVHAGSGAVFPDDMLFLEQRHFDLCFLGTAGISETYGYTTGSAEDANTKKTILKNSKTAFVLGDSNKFGVTRYISFAPLEQSTLITNTAPDFTIPDFNVIIA